MVAQDAENTCLLVEGSVCRLDLSQVTGCVVGNGAGKRDILVVGDICGYRHMRRIDDVTTCIRDVVRKLAAECGDIPIRIDHSIGNADQSLNVMNHHRPNTQRGDVDGRAIARHINCDGLRNATLYDQNLLVATPIQLQGHGIVSMNKQSPGDAPIRLVEPSVGVDIDTICRRGISIRGIDTCGSRITQSRILLLITRSRQRDWRRFWDFVSTCIQNWVSAGIGLKAVCHRRQTTYGNTFKV